MPGRVATAALLVLILGATSAFACPTNGGECFFLPSPSASTVPQRLLVAGWGADGAIDPAAEFIVTLRDLGNFPQWGRVVVVDFSHCAPAVICGVSGNSCDSLDAPLGRVTAITNTDGRAVFRVAGCARNSGGTPVPGGGTATVSSCGVLLRTVPVAFSDQDGDDGLGANDLSAWLGDAFGASYFARSDYDGDGTLGANDLSVWLGYQGRGLSAMGCATPR